MPVYPDFPTMATATPPLVSAIVRHGDPTYEHPNYTLKYENGVPEVRAITSTGRWSKMPVSIVVSDAPNPDLSNDFQTLMSFLQTQKLGVSPFNYQHPKLGKGIVRYGSQDGTDKVTPHLEVNGLINWWRFDLVLEGQFNA